MMVNINCMMIFDSIALQLPFPSNGHEFILLSCKQLLCEHGGHKVGMGLSPQTPTLVSHGVGINFNSQPLVPWTEHLARLICFCFSWEVPSIVLLLLSFIHNDSRMNTLKASCPMEVVTGWVSWVDAENISDLLDGNGSRNATNSWRLFPQHFIGCHPHLSKSRQHYLHHSWFINLIRWGFHQIIRDSFGWRPFCPDAALIFIKYQLWWNQFILKTIRHKTNIDLQSSYKIILFSSNSL